tara:strand:- start:2746 stop:3630 length:885 start_codon:yes stop_codon:yes gene_type:complete
MKYRGKYNLKENLFLGRGMRLLREYSVARPTISAADTCEPVKGTTYTGADFAALNNSADVDALVKCPSGKRVGWITQKKAAKKFLDAGAKIAWIGSGSQQEDLVVVIGGTQYSVEVGRPTKVTQLGQMAGNAVSRTEDTTKKTISKQRAVGASIKRGNNPKHPGVYNFDELDANVASGGITLGQMGSYWRADGVDFLLMISEQDKKDNPNDVPSFKICACSEEGMAAGKTLFGGVASMADIINLAYREGKHKTRGKSGSEQFANTRGGEPSEGNTHRGGFGAFPKVLKDNMTSI